jgi:hypothetical protein
MVVIIGPLAIGGGMIVSVIMTALVSVSQIMG